MSWDVAILKNVSKNSVCFLIVSLGICQRQLAKRPDTRYRMTSLFLLQREVTQEF